MTTEYDGLEPIEPDEALRLYLDHEETESSKNTVQAHRYRLRYFVERYDVIGLSKLHDLTDRRLQEYRLRRKEHGDLVQTSLDKQMSTVRALVKWCGFIETVPQDLDSHTEEDLVVLDSDFYIFQDTWRIRDAGDRALLAEINSRGALFSVARKILPRVNLLLIGTM